MLQKCGIYQIDGTIDAKFEKKKKTKTCQSNCLCGKSFQIGMFGVEWCSLHLDTTKII
jgi:hypothetical protein